MSRFAITNLFFFFLLPPYSYAAPASETPNEVQRASELKEYLRKEKPHFEQRETQKKDLMEELDRLNVEQNEVRQRLGAIHLTSQELAMASENLAMEMKKQKEIEGVHKRRLLGLLKVTYKIQKEGIFRFLLNRDGPESMAARIRILFHTLRANTLMEERLEERARRLSNTEKKLIKSRSEMENLVGELKVQEGLLGDLLKKRQILLSRIAQKQRYYKASVTEYRKISHTLSTLFSNFEAMRDSDQIIFPNRGSLPLPVELGKVVKNFGKSIHEKFQTVIFNKGVEIEADHNMPVTAVLPGIVEYDGWVKGLGNVVILHHGGGFYSLSAHLFKTVKSQGSRVVQGETIGFVGDTGNNEKPSLYFEIRENGKAVDPVAYFSPSAKKSLQ